MRVVIQTAVSLLCIIPFGCRPDDASSTPNGGSKTDLVALRLEARSKFVPIITEARNVPPDDPNTARSRFASFKRQNPDLFTFPIDGVAVNHIDVSQLDLAVQHSQVFIWAWLGEMGVIGYSDGHVESTQDRALYDAVVKAGRGHLRAGKVTHIENGTMRTETVRVGPPE